MQKQLTIVLLLCLGSTLEARRSCCPCCCNSKKVIHGMQKDIEKVTEAVDKLFGNKDTKMEKKEKQPKETVSFDLNDNAVVIKLSLTEGISDFNVSAQDNLLTVDIPEKNKKLTVRYDKKTASWQLVPNIQKKRKKKKKGSTNGMNLSDVQNA